jgi:hypothetical protein
LYWILYLDLIVLYLDLIDRYDWVTLSDKYNSKVSFGVVRIVDYCSEVYATIVASSFLKLMLLRSMARTALSEGAYLGSNPGGATK